MKDFIQMKIGMIEAAIREFECQEDDDNYVNGLRDGYIGARYLELETLNEILDKLG